MGQLPNTFVRVVVLSLISGAIWGVGLFGLKYPLLSLGHAPLIGVAAGLACARFPPDGFAKRLTFSLVSLYAAGVALWICASRGDQIIYLLIGITMLIAVLGPAAWLNHLLIAKVWQEGRSRTTIGLPPA